MRRGLYLQDSERCFQRLDRSIFKVHARARCTREHLEWHMIVKAAFLMPGSIFSRVYVSRTWN